VIYVSDGTSAVCRIKQVYPDLLLEHALNSDMLLNEFASHPGDGASLQHLSDGYYDAPWEVMRNASFSSSPSLRERFQLCAEDWQAYAARQEKVVKFRVVADGGIVDTSMHDPLAAFDLYQQVQASYDILRLSVEVYAQDGDGEPLELADLLRDGEIEDLH
jgi:hypothetical protein